MKTYTLGILGAGMWGRVLADRFDQDRRARVTWMNSATEASARTAVWWLAPFSRCCQ